MPFGWTNRSNTVAALLPLGHPGAMTTLTATPLGNFPQDIGLTHFLALVELSSGGPLRGRNDIEISLAREKLNSFHLDSTVIGDRAHTGKS